LVHCVSDPNCLSYKFGSTQTLGPVLKDIYFHV
jgi:hypothetical protein